VMRVYNLAGLPGALFPGWHSMWWFKLQRVESRVESAWFQLLKLTCDELFSSFASKFHLHRYNMSIFIIDVELSEILLWYGIRDHWVQRLKL